MARFFSFLTAVAACAALAIYPLLTVAHEGPRAAPPQEGDNPSARAAWFREGRVTAGGQEPAAGKLRRALAMRRAIERVRESQARRSSSLRAIAATQWTPIENGPIEPDPSQSYGLTTGRVTAIAVDAADPTGNTILIGAAGGGIWRSTNALAANPATVEWTPLSDGQPSLAIGALAQQPGNRNLILAGTGETDNSGDAYYGMGMLRSSDGGTSWQLISGTADGTTSFDGLGFSAIAFSSDNPNLVVAAAAAAPEAAEVGAPSTGATRSLYYSADAGQNWRRATFSDPDSTVLQPDSVTSAVYNGTAHLFYAAYRYHGYYASPDGQHWARLQNQPGAGSLAEANCPAATSFNCPLYRGELAVQPQSGELFAWSVDGNNNDGGIYRSADGGSTWAPVHTFGDGVTNCGDAGLDGVTGCGTDQGTFNLALMAVSTAGGTDLYAGAVNVFRCSLTPANPFCQKPGSWLNLTHVYGCVANTNFHPDQHAMAFVPAAAGTVLFGNDGGLYRARNAPLLQGSCSAPSAFESLNARLGPLTQLTGFSQDANSAQTIQIGSQDNGTAATADQAEWRTVGGGDGGYSQIDPGGNTWLNSGNYVDIESCGEGAGCNSPAAFTRIITSSDTGGDAAPFFVRYILDPGLPGRLLLGTCRVWSGSANWAWSSTPGTAISPNLSSSGAQCTPGDDMIRSLAAGGAVTAAGSSVIYAGTRRGLVWVTHNAAAGASGWPAAPAFRSPGANCNGSGCPISDIALDPGDATGATAYISVMGFNTPHIYRTNDFGATWTDLTGNLPDAPANAVLVDPEDTQTLYAGTDAGVFVTMDGGQSWSPYGSGLPNAPVLQLRAFVNGSEGVLRAATYGRGLWQAPLATTSAPGFSIASQASSLEVTAAQPASSVITITLRGNFNGPLSFACAGLPPGANCSFSPATLTNVAAAASTTLTISAGQTSAEFRHKPAPWYWGSLPVTAIAVLAFGRGRRMRWMVFTAMAVAAFSTGCGTTGGSSRPSGLRPPGADSYSITIIATSGLMQSTASIAVNIQ
ncbi:MAG: hypothetical protein JO041_16540 [Acidobacteria bacterium]|nr:hypothetical protein [Acidobacteriota bacterium]